jgi:MraZ protein
MSDWAQNVAMVEPPRGMYPGRTDDRGRLKLPVGFANFFGALREKPLFVTSLDRRIASAYPLSIWREREKALSEYKDDPELARKLEFNAADLGSECEMDGQGRILLSPELRRALGIENASVRVVFKRGRMDIYSEAVYEEMRQSAAVASPERSKAEAAGLI